MGEWKEFFLSDEALGTFVPIIVYWVYSGFYVFLQSLDAYRLHTVKEEKMKNSVSKSTVVKGVLLQQSVQALVALLLFRVTGEAGESGITLQPSLMVQARQCLIAMLVFDTWQYFLHRYMHHNKFLYRTIHSKHHKLIVPWPFGAMYNHPVEGLLLDTIGGALSFLLSGMTPRTAIYFFSFATIKWLRRYSLVYRPTFFNSASCQIRAESPIKLFVSAFGCVGDHDLAKLVPDPSATRSINTVYTQQVYHYKEVTEAFQCNHSTMAASIMGVVLLVVWLTLCGFSSCSVPRELLPMNSTSNETDANAASAAASFFLGNDTTTITPTPSTPVSAGITWCVAKNNIDDTTLQVALDYACGLGGADCTKIQQGGVCFEPDNVQSHASYAFNNYYMKNGMVPGTCDFGGSAAPITLNPSHGTCVYDTVSTTSILNGTIPGSGGSITGVPNISNSMRPTAIFMTPSIFIMISLVIVKLG